MNELQSVRIGTRRWWVAAGISVALIVAMVYLRIEIYPHRMVPLTYALPMLIALWHCDRWLLWGMAVCFVAVSVYKVFLLLPAEYFDDGFQRLLYMMMQWLNIVIPAAVMHVVLDHRDALARSNHALATANRGLEASNEELASREEEVSRQNEELRSQAEELELQSEELRTTTEELAMRETTLQKLVALAAPATSEAEILGQICAIGPGLLGEDVSAIAIFERRDGEMLLHSHSELAAGATETKLPAHATLAGVVLERKEVALLEDTRLRPDLAFPAVPAGQPPRSALAVPMSVGGAMAGALEVYAPAPRQWTGQQIQLAQWLAAQCSRVWENVRLRDSLRESEERYRIVADHTFDWEFWLSPEGRIRYISPSAAAITGYPAQVDQDIADFLRQVVHPDDLEARLTHVQEELRDQRPGEMEFRIIRADGEVRWIHHVCRAMYDPQGRFLGSRGSNRDVTKRKRTEDELQRTAEELARSNKDLEQFAYVASHDLQEPLRMVAGYLELLADRYRGKLDEKADKYINYAVDGAIRMSGLIQDLLAYSRVHTRGEKMRETSMEEALEIALKSLAPAIEESGAMIHHDPLPLVRADRTQLYQLFQNLIGNALKFRSAEVRPEVRIGVLREEARWLVSIADNGIGFDDRYQEKMFLIFQRLHSRAQFPGTGMGLAICKRIIERHGGQIWANSRPGQGATIYFTLPIAGNL